MVSAPASRRIVTDADILDGEPIIEGTRIPIRAIVLAWRSADRDPKKIVQRFPPLRKADITAALRYYEAHREQIEALIAENELEGYIPEERPDFRCPPPPSI